MRPQHWLYLEIESPSAEHHAVLVEGLIASGATAVEERDDRLVTWLPSRAAAEQGTGEAARIAHIRSTLEQAAGVALRVRGELRADEDWEARWRDGLCARRVGRHIIVTPSWITPEREPGDIVIVIDPEMAFGTGEHASTRAALRLVEVAAPAACRVLDVGTGSGILAIAAARLGASHVDAVDCDADAVLNAAGNLARNDCANRITLFQAMIDLDYLYGTAVAAGGYDVIAANVLSGVLIQLLSGFHAAIRPGGALILAGILETEADAVIEEAARNALALTREDRDDGWWAGSFQRSGA